MHPTKFIQMIFLLLPTLGLLALTRGDYLLFDDLCETVYTSMTCLCENRENFTVSPIYDHELTDITIRGCGTVVVSFGALTSLQLDDLEFSDIESLHLFPFSLSLGGLITFKIENISDLNVQQHAFVGLSHVENMIFTNVTSKTLPREAFGSISNIKFFLINRSTFYHIETFAFHSQNITTFRVISSQFDTFENLSILIQHTEEVLFEDCHFLETEENTFALSFVDTVTFLGCTFGKLATSYIQTKELQTFTFSKCSIGVLYPDAFAALEVREKVIFSNNTIEIAHEGSLTPFISQTFKDIIVEYCCNYFTCDCNVYWILDFENLRPNTSVLENCICANDRTKDLSFYTPVLDSYNNCMTLELTSTVVPEMPIINLLETNFAMKGKYLDNFLKLMLFCLMITKLRLNVFII